MRRAKGLLAAVLALGACGGDSGTIDLAFSGSACAGDLPESVAPGSHEFVLENPTDATSLPVYVVRLTDGRSYEELAALQPAAGDYFVLPDWAEFSDRNFQDDEADEGRRRFGFELEPGNHAVYLWASRPAAIWLCGPLAVTTP